MLLAFTAAKRALRVRRPDPFHWAPFLYVGSPDQWAFCFASSAALHLASAVQATPPLRGRPISSGRPFAMPIPSSNRLAYG
jgi:hypothetical protein